MADPRIARAVIVSAATVLGGALWFAAVGVGGPTCTAPSDASIEALFASCTGPRVAAAPDEGPRVPVDVEATGATNTR